MLPPEFDPPLARAEQIFMQLEEVEAIMATLDVASVSEPPSSAPFAKLARFVAGQGQADSFQACRADVRIFRKFLANTGPAYAPRLAAAASSGRTQTREGEGCRISLRPSRADPEQVYVVVEMTRPEGVVPRHLFLSLPDGLFSRFDLPEPDGMVFQILAQADSGLVRGLSSPETEVFLH